jgi:phosphoribosylformylglycinamidine synthase
VSGNVSLYNETDGVGIPPTPVVGGVGLIENLDHIATLSGAQEGDLLVLIAPERPEASGPMGASLYARVILGLEGPEAGSPPLVDLAEEKRNAACVRHLIQAGKVRAVHDISEGGLICAAAEMALASGVGVTIDPPPAPGRGPVAERFGETQASYLLAVDPEIVERLLEEAPAPGSMRIQGRFGGNRITIRFNSAFEAAGEAHLSLASLRAAHEGWLPAFMQGKAG